MFVGDMTIWKAKDYKTFGLKKESNIWCIDKDYDGYTIEVIPFGIEKGEIFCAYQDSPWPNGDYYVSMLVAGEPSYVRIPVWDMFSYFKYISRLTEADF